MISPGVLMAAMRSAPRRTLAFAGFWGAMFVVLAILVSLGATRAMDLAWTRTFQSVASYPMDVVANAHTVVGQLAVTLPLAIALAFVSQRRFGGYVWLGPLMILLTGGIELLLKNITAHPAPPPEFVRAFGNPLGIPRSLQPPFAFPSGHVARITFLALVVGAMSPRAVAWAGAAAIVAISLFLRVYIGDHWLSDALGGAALGAGAAVLAVAWMRATARR